MIRLNKCQDANLVQEVAHILGPNPPRGNRSGLRRESPIEIPSPSEPVKESELDPKGKVACEEFRKRQTSCTHRGSVDASISLRETSKKKVNFVFPLGDGGGKSSTQTESVQDIMKGTNKTRTIPPPHSSQQTDETTALDKELRDIADKATMRALKRKLDEAEEVEKKARSTLAGTQARKKGLLRRVKELNKEEVENHSAAAKAQQLIDELKQRITQQESVSLLVSPNESGDY